MAEALVSSGRVAATSGRSVQRILRGADLKPHREMTCIQALERCFPNSPTYSTTSSSTGHHRSRHVQAATPDASSGRGPGRVLPSARGPTSSQLTSDQVRLPSSDLAQ